MSVHAKLVRDGNSWCIRLPKEVLALSGLNPGEEVDMTVQPGRIVIRSRSQPIHPDEIEQARKDAKQAWNLAFEDAWLSIFGVEE